MRRVHVPPQGPPPRNVHGTPVDLPREPQHERHRGSRPIARGLVEPRPTRRSDVGAFFFSPAQSEQRARVDLHRVHSRRKLRGDAPRQRADRRARRLVRRHVRALRRVEHVRDVHDRAAAARDHRGEEPTEHHGDALGVVQETAPVGRARLPQPRRAPVVARRVRIVVKSRVVVARAAADDAGDALRAIPYKRLSGWSCEASDGVQRRRGRGLKARCGRRETTGKCIERTSSHSAAAPTLPSLRQYDGSAPTLVTTTSGTPKENSAPGRSIVRKPCIVGHQLKEDAIER
eukprot:31422-Pelagococcus_subviridis.AAC.16